MGNEQRISSSQQKFISSLFDQAVDRTSTGILSELDKLRQRYINEEHIASGGLKEIRICQDEATGRKVAKAVLKEVRNELDIEVFLREARIGASLQHPNIVPVYDIGLDDEKRPFFTMKLIEGKSLHDLLTERKNGKDVSLKYLLDILLKVTDAVSYAHSKGVLHLDIKPENIQLSDYGEVLLCDWGLARIIEEQFEEEKYKDYSFSEIHDSNNTVDGFIKGTPGYLSPEQAAPGKRKDQRSDIYSLGVILYEIITLEKPVLGKNVAEILANTVDGNITPPSTINNQVSSSLEAICLKALSTDPNKRYQTTNELYTDIQAYNWGYTTKAENAGFIKIVWHLIKRNAAVAVVSAVSCIVLICALAYFIYNIKESERLAQKQKDKALQALDAVKKAKAVNSFFTTRFLEDLLSDAERSYEKGDFEKAQRYLKYTGKKGFELLARIRILQKRFSEAEELIKQLENNKMKELTAVLQLLRKIEGEKQKDLQTSLSLLLDLPKGKVSPEDILKVESLEARKILLQKFAPGMTVRERVRLIEKIVIQEDGLPPEFEFRTSNQGSLTFKVLNGYNKFKSIHYVTYVGKVEALYIYSSAVTSLEALSTMPIRILGIYDTQFTDISALKEMPLKKLRIDVSKVKDISPLFKIKSLEELILRGIKLTKAQKEKLPPSIRLSN